MNRGKFAVLSIFAIAIAMAVFAIVYQAQQDRKLLEAWSSQHITRIRRAPRVELVEFTDDAEPMPGLGDLSIADTAVPIVSRRDVSDALGLVHARHVLIQDSSYIWSDQPVSIRDSVWSFGFVFTDSEGTSTVVLDENAETVYLLEAGVALTAGEMGQRLKKYLAEALSPTETSASE